MTTSTNIQTSTSVVRTTTTSTTTIENLCQPTGTKFRLPLILPPGGNGAGEQRWLSLASDGQLLAQNIPTSPSTEQRRRSTFEVSGDRSLKGMYGTILPWVSSYATIPTPGATTLVKMNTQIGTDTEVFFGTARRVSVCVDRRTRGVRLFDGLGRQNLAVCEMSNRLAMSSGDGTDRATCRPVVITAQIV
ncbi:hypothetical protein MN608_11353 [Microdochium nivale]|nr:hypothetical protein MN608_11353 [Microdochium nivale]